MKVLLVCHFVRLPYRVMRCASLAGAEVYVLGDGVSKLLRFSRFCKRLYKTSCPFDGSVSTDMVDQINKLSEELGIDVVMPGDPESSRSFAGIRDQLSARAFPGPSLKVFDLLNDKSSFAALCTELDIPHPKSTFFCRKEQLISEISSGNLGFPLVVKPLDQYGSRGFLKITKENAAKQLEGFEYDKAIAQEFVPGSDIGASVFCRQGRILTFIAHELVDGVYRTFERPDVYEVISRLAKHLSLEGVYNFDMRLTKEDQAVFLECNPRVFFKMFHSAIAGINFLEPGLFPDRSGIATGRSEPTKTRGSRALVKVVHKPWVLSQRDRQFAQSLVNDPINLLIELTRIDAYN